LKDGADKAWAVLINRPDHLKLAEFRVALLLAVLLKEEGVVANVAPKLDIAADKVVSSFGQFRIKK